MFTKLHYLPEGHYHSFVKSISLNTNVPMRVANSKLQISVCFIGNKLKFLATEIFYFTPRTENTLCVSKVLLPL